MDTLSQNKKIREWLESGKSITALEALREFGCLRLSARIFDLREQGMVIKTSPVEINGKWLARYTKEDKI